MLKAVYEDVQNSDGSAQKELDSYLSSIDGKMAKLQNRTQEFWSVAINTDSVKSGIDMITGLVSGVTSLVDALGLIPTAMAGVSGALSFKNLGKCM